MVDNPFAAELARRGGSEPPAADAGLVNPFAAELAKREGSGAAGVGKQVVYGANRSIFANLPDPTAPLNYALEAIGIDEPGSYERRKQERTERRRKLFYPVDPKTPAERVASAAGEMIPETLATGGAMTALGKLAPKVPGVVEGVTKRVLRAVSEPYAAAPAKLAVADAAAGAGAGAGTQVYRESTDDPMLGGEVASGLAGGTAVTAVPTAVVAASRISPVLAGARILKNIVASAIPDEAASRIPGMTAARRNAEARAREKGVPIAAKELEGLKQPQAQAQMQNAERLRDEIPGFNPSLAEATDLPSAVATQRQIEAKSTGGDLDRLAQRRALSEAAVDRYAKAEAPTGPANAPRTIEDAVTNRLDQARTMLARQQQQAQRRGQTVAQDLPETDLFGAGDRLRGRMLDLRTETSARMRAEAERLGINETADVPLQPLQERLRGVIPSRLAEGETLGTILPRTLNRPANAEPLTLADVRYLREQLGDEARVASRAGERYKARILGNAQEQVDGFLDDVGQSAFGQRWQEFRDIYRREFIDRFERGATREARARGADNDFKVQAEDVGREWFSPYGITNARQFRQTFGDDAEAQAALRDIALDSLRRAAVRDGEIRPADLNRWVARHGSVLDEFPALRQEVGNLGNATRAVAQRQADLRMRAERIENTVLARALGKGAEGIIDEAVTNPAQAAALVRRLPEPARRAAARLVWDRAIGREEIDPERIGAFIADHAQSLRHLMRGDHIAALRNIQEAAAMHSRVPRPMGQASDADPFKNVTEAVGSGPQQIMSRAFAAVSGRTSKRWAIFDLLTRARVASSRQQANEMLRQALYDREFARELASYVSQRHASPAATRRLRAYVTALGLNAMEDGPVAAQGVAAEPEQQPAPTPVRAPSVSELREVLDDDRAVDEIMRERLSRDQLQQRVQGAEGDGAMAEALRRAAGR